MTTDHPSQQHTRHPVREALTLTLACLAYSVLSFLARASESLAFSHAHSIVAFERRVGLFIEPPANAWLAAHPTLASLASMQYATTFLLFTGLTLVALWIKAPQCYSRARWTLVVMTLGALVTYWSYPLAPPRLVPGLGILHPTLTIVTIVATGNHYVVDAIAGFTYFLIAWLCVTLAHRTLLKNVRSTGETS